jgi:integrase
MPSLIKRSTGLYHIYWYNANQHPKQISESLKTRSKTEADRRMSRLVTEYYEGNHNPWKEKWYEKNERKKQESRLSYSETLLLKIEEYIQIKSDPDVGVWSEETARSTSYRLRLYAKMLGEELPVSSFDSDTIHRVVGSHVDNPHTKESDIRKLKAFFLWATNEEIKIKSFKAPERLPVFIPTDDLTEVFNYWNKSIEKETAHQKAKDSLKEIYVDMWKFASRTGLRKHELINIKVSDIQNNNVLIGADFKTKTNKQRIVPLMDWAEEVAERFKDPEFRSSNSYLDQSDYLFGSNSPHFGNDVSRYFGKACKKVLGVRRTLHNLRHTFAVWYLTSESEKNKDFRLVALKNLLGHSSIETTMIYTKLLPDHYRL